MSTAATTSVDPHAEHPAHLQHHFATMDQQFDASKMGMWLFLITEVLLFSGMFVAYAVFRSWYPESFDEAAGLLDWRMGGLNTLVLLGSSFTVALGIHFIQVNNKKALVLNLIITLLLAGVFMTVKYFEYTGKWAHGVYPGAAYAPFGEMHGHDLKEFANLPYAAQYMSIYFIMTGIHGFHVLVGMGIFVWLIIRARRGDFDAEYYTPVELSGLYWHLVDIIWIFLFPLLYLI